MSDIASWLPREHGAWAQLAFPMLTALAVAGVSLPGALLILAALMAFLIHEPLTVLAGGRGARKRELEGERARRFVLVAGLLAALAGTSAAGLSEPQVRVLVLALALPVAGLAALAFLGKDKTTAGELLAGAAFAVLALPLAASAERPDLGLEVSATWAVCFALSTLAVRGVTVRAHGKRDPGAQRCARRLSLAGALVGAAVLPASISSVAAGKLPAAVAGGIAPFALFSIVCWFAPPKPARLKRIGWGLAGCCVITFAVLAAGLRN